MLKNKISHLIYSIIISLISIPFTHAQTIDNSDLKTSQALLEEKISYITIKGNTNINNFECTYERPQHKDTIFLVRNKNEVLFKDAIIKLETTNFACENDIMDKEFENLLEAELYPYISIDLKSLHLKPETNTGNFNGNLTISGIKQPATFSFTSTNNTPGTYDFKGNLEVDITDFGLTPPEKFMGLIKTDKIITVQFYLSFKLIKNHAQN